MTDFVEDDEINVCKIRGQVWSEPRAVDVRRGAYGVRVAWSAFKRFAPRRVVPLNEKAACQLGLWANRNSVGVIAGGAVKGHDRARNGIELLISWKNRETWCVVTNRCRFWNFIPNFLLGNNNSKTLSSAAPGTELFEVKVKGSRGISMTPRPQFAFFIFFIFLIWQFMLK